MKKIKKTIISILLITIITIIPANTIYAIDEKDNQQLLDQQNENLDTEISGEYKIKTNPIPKPYRALGPFAYFWIDANLSKEEFTYFYYNQEKDYITMHVEFLKGEENDESYIKWGTLFNPPSKPNIFDHKNPYFYYYYQIQFENIKKKNVEFSNNRVKIKANGFNGLILVSWTKEPIHDTTVPRLPSIIGPIIAKPNKQHSYTFFSRSYNNYDLSYYIDWGDGTNTGWIGPYESLEDLTLTHSWDSEGTFIISAKAKDIYYQVSGEMTFEVKISSKISVNLQQINQQMINQGCQQININSQSSNC